MRIKFRIFSDLFEIGETEELKAFQESVSAFVNSIGGDKLRVEVQWLQTPNLPRSFVLTAIVTYLE